MIPAIYRNEDGLAKNPGLLGTMVQVMAKQAAHLTPQPGRLQEDARIDKLFTINCTMAQ
jgi:hypothetical protein